MARCRRLRPSSRESGWRELYPVVGLFLDEMAYYLDSYAKGYLNDELVNELMIEECKIDVINEIDYSNKKEQIRH